MKKFLRVLSLLFIVIPAAWALFSFAVSAETERAVVYISDNGTGDGSSPDSPLGNGENYYTWSRKAYESSAINRAIAMLAENGHGGTIVVAGPVSILWGQQSEADAIGASDFYFSPTQLDPSICISFTSSYGGVDYRKANGAAIILEKTASQNLSLGMHCRTVWNNILFRINYTQDARVESTGGVFACCCNETIIGHSVDTEVFLEGSPVDPTPANAYYFFNLAGGHRYSNQNGSTNLTVESGHWQSVSGGPVGFRNNADYGRLNGSVTLSIGGTAVVLCDVDGGCYNLSGSVTGNVLVSITGGKIIGSVIVGGDGGFSGTCSTAKLEISGGDFSECREILPYGKKLTFNPPGTAVLDCRKLRPEKAGAIIDLALNNPVAPFDTVYSPVVFIKDGATGTGLTPDSPLAAESLSGDSVNLHYDSVLYQAAKLLMDTDGVVVFVGDVLLNIQNTKGVETSTTKDMFLPDCSGHHLTLTSVWDGVDYGKTNGAKLILQTPAELICGGPTTIENLTICTMPNETQNAQNRGIFANGFDLTVGDGVTCVPLDKNGKVISSPASNVYPSIYGGHRYTNITSDQKDGLLITSGTFYHAAGASKGFTSTASTYGRVNGDTRITIDGTAVILDGLYASGEMKSAFQLGDAYITVKGGTVNGAVYMATEGGFGGNTYTSRLTVTGGNISISSVQARASQLTDDGRPRYNPQTVILDLSNASAASVSALRNYASGFDAVYVPASSVTRTALMSQVAKTVYYEGETFDPSGFAVSLTAYSRKYFAPYDESVSAFSFVPSLSTPLTADDVSVSAYYGTNLIASIPITVEEGPSVRMEGAMIRLVSEKQSLRFVATIDNADAGSVSEYGIIAIRQDCFSERSTDQVGAKKIVCTRADTLYMNMNELTFGAVVPDIPIEEYSVPYTAFAYAVFQKDGELVTVTSSPITRSVEEVARAAVSMGKESESAVEKLNDNVIRAVEERWTSSYDAEEVAYRTSKIIDNLYTMSTLTWYCPVDMDFSGDSSFTGSLKYKAGTTYTGMPYIAGDNGYASYNQWNALYPDGATYTGATGWNTMLGNMCSSALVRAWEPVISTKYNNLALSLQKKDEFILVGQCVLPDNYQRTKDIVNANLIISAENADDIAQRVYENYAQARRGDYLYSNWVSSDGEGLGHIRMIDSTHPVWNSDGTISGSQSYLITYEQCSSLNTTLKSTWRMQYKYPYQDLCNRSLTSTSSAKYLAIRPTVHATSYYPTPALMLKDRNTSENVGKGLKGTVSSNYYISEIHLTVTDAANGSAVLTLDDYPYRRNAYEIAEIDAEGRFASLPSGNYHYSLTLFYAEESATVAFDFTK